MDLAATRGISTYFVRSAAIAAAGVMTSVVVAVCGPISFIGLVVPNALRHHIGADLKHLLPASAFMGASCLVLADILSRLLERYTIIPVGVILALVGAPIFVYILFKSGDKSTGNAASS